MGNGHTSLQKISDKHITHANTVILQLSNTHFPLYPYCILHKKQMEKNRRGKNKSQNLSFSSYLKTQETTTSTDLNARTQLCSSDDRIETFSFLWLYFEIFFKNQIMGNGHTNLTQILRQKHIRNANSTTSQLKSTHIPFVPIMYFPRKNTQRKVGKKKVLQNAKLHWIQNTKLCSSDDRIQIFAFLLFYFATFSGNQIMGNGHTSLAQILRQ